MDKSEPDQRNKKLSEAEIKSVFEMISNGDRRAREEVILAHLPFVRGIARKYVNKGVPFEDLFQEGCYGLIQAVDNYIFKPNAYFKTYAWYYITKYIRIALIEQSSSFPIVLSPEYHDRLRKYKSAYCTLESKLNRTPKIEEIAQFMNVSPEMVRHIQRHDYKSVSLDAEYKPYQPQNNTQTITHDRLSATPGISCPTEKEALSLLGPQIDILRNILTETEYDILCSRIGINDTGKPEPYTSIAKRKNTSVYHIQKRYDEAIRKLRKSLGINHST